VSATVTRTEASTPGEAELVEALSGVLGADQLLLGAAADPYWRELKPNPREPIAVAKPGTTEEVAAVVRLCHQRGVPVVARGHGSSLAGGVVPSPGGIVLSLERLDTLAIDPANSWARAGAGTVTARLQAEAATFGFMYPPDPLSAEFSTVGGNVATNAGGGSALKYGTTADYVLGMTAVLADGRILRLGGTTRRGGGGYRLAQLFVGSEGTLGIITELSLRLVPLAAQRAAALIGYAELSELGPALQELLVHGPLPAAVEVLDRGALELMSDRLPPGFPGDLAAALLVDVDGHDPGLVQLEVEAAADRMGGTDNRISQSAEERRRLWELVTGLGRAIRQTGAAALQEDVSVPVDRVGDMLHCLQDLARREGVRLATTGHAGDGSLHPWLLLDGLSGAVQASRLQELIVETARELGGSLAGEYGIGLLKRELLSAENDPEALRIMRQLKGLLDPDGLLNPGKLLPEP
jgi:glycolate oxidase subunit GlcD